MLRVQPLSHAPAFIRRSGPITGRLLGFGLPMGPNRVLTMHGRRSGRPIDVPLAVLELDNRRWVVGTFGETNWVRNLRFDPRAELHVGSRVEGVQAVELGPAAREHFFRETVPTYVRNLPLRWRVFLRLFMRSTAPEILTDPALAATRRPVFELVANCLS